MKLVIDNISKQYKERTVVDNFSAELTKGVYALLGPNGSGKTTLMRMLAGVLSPSSGRILLNGEDIIILDEKYRDKLGYLPQEFGLYTQFSAEKFLMYFASLKGLDKKQARVKVDEVLNLVNLTNERKRKTGTFSGGMKRRLGIAQALLNDPEILIVDEPTAGLDPNERIRFRNLLSEIAMERIVLVSTHIVSDIEYIAKEIMLIQDGKLIHHSSLNDLLTIVKEKVWIAKLQQDELSSLRRKYKIGNIQYKETDIEARIISDTQPSENAILVEPTLEDVYLYFFNQEGLADV